jgi:glycosyltransferase involved in cell wall biosynthesis
VKLAVFTSKYPAVVATFFERDMRSLLEAGVEIDVFPIYPLDAGMWRYSLNILDKTALPRDRVHHLSFGESVRQALVTLGRSPATALWDAARILGASVRYGPVPAAKSSYALMKSWAWAARHGAAYDHILAYWGNYAGSCAYAFHRLNGRNVPFSIWLHAGTDLYRTPVFLRSKMAYADNIITCCEFNQEYIRKSFQGMEDVTSARLHVCHHGLDLAQFPYRPEGRPRRHVLAVGRLARFKGFDYLLRAAALLNDRGVELSVELVGDGDQRRALEVLAARLGIAERVTFRGWLPFPEARDAMSRATVLVHPSDGLGDGLPNVVREAMALGTPVIGSKVAGIPDALGGECGVLVPPKDPALLASAIEVLLENAEARARIADRARRRVEERYDMWRNGRWLAQLLRDTRRHATVASPEVAREELSHARV